MALGPYIWIASYTWRVYCTLQNKEYANNKEIVVSPADIQFEEELTINLGGITAKLFHTESPHSDDTVVIYLPEERKNTLCEYCVLSHTEPLLKHDLLEYLESL